MRSSQYKLLSILISVLLGFFFFSSNSYASQGNPNIYYVEEENTIYVRSTQSEIETIVNLPDIAAAINDESLLKEESPKVWLLKANLWVKGSSKAEKGITLQLTDETMTWLKLKSNSSGFIWLKSYNSDVLIQNTKITSWDESAGSYDTNYSDGRSFILTKYNSRMDITNSELAYLGYKSGESYGVSWRIKEETKGQYIVTGEIINSKFHHNYYGGYSFGAEAMVFRNNEFYQNIQYGLDPHDDSNNFLVEENAFYENGNHGLIFSRNCINNTIRNNTSYNNALSGIMLDRDSNNNTVENNTTYGNVNGIALYSSHNNTIKNNIVYQNERGILFKDYSSSNLIEGNQIYENTQYGIYFYNGVTANTISNNEIHSNTKVGVYIKTDKNIVGPANTIYGNEKGISLYDSGANNNTIKENNIYENKYGVVLKIASQNTIESNEVHDNNSHGVYLYSTSENNKISGNNVYSNSSRGIYLKESNSNEVNNNTVKLNNSYGIYIYKSSSNTISGNTAERNKRGIYLKEQANGNTLEGNSVFDNNEYGIYLYSASNGNTISGNQVYSNPKDGIYLSASSQNNLSDNTVTSNARYGVYLYEGSNENIVSANTLESNKRGIYIKLSDNNGVHHNSVKLNTEYAIYLYDAQDNTFIGNTLLDNDRNYYYAKFQANNTIQDTDSIAVKVYDNESSMNIVDTRNYILQNNKNVATIAEPTKTSITLTRAITGAVVTFEKLNFKVTPSSDQVNVTPQVWETSPDYYKKWMESSPGVSTVAEHMVGDLRPNTLYDVIVDGVVWNSYTSDSEGILTFLYDDGYSEKIFEIRKAL